MKQPKKPLGKAPLNLLRAFQCAGKHLSFKLAAEELCITPPAVSHQIKTLEERLGVPLFIRNNRELTFTQSGHDYWNRVNSALQSLDQATAQLQGSQKRITLSVMPPLAGSLVIPNLSGFQQAHPHITLQVDANIQNVSIENGEADIAIRYGNGQWGSLSTEKLLTLYVQPIFPLQFAEHYDFSDPEQIQRLPLIHMKARPNAWQRWFAESGLGTPHPDQEYHLDDYPSAIEAAKTLGGALAAMPLEQHLVDKGIVIAPLPKHGPLEDGVFAVYRPQDHSNPEVIAVINWIKQLLQEAFPI